MKQSAAHKSKFSKIATRDQQTQDFKNILTLVMGQIT